MVVSKIRRKFRRISLRRFRGQTNSSYTKKSVIPKMQKSALTTGLFTQKFGITDFEKRQKTHRQKIWQENFGYNISHPIKLFEKRIVIDSAQRGVRYAGMLPTHRFFNGIPLVLCICISVNKGCRQIRVTKPLGHEGEIHAMLVKMHGPRMPP